MVGSRVSDVMAVAESESGVATAECVNRLVSRSQEILSEHPVNLRRVAEGTGPPTSYGLGVPLQAGHAPL